MAVSIGRVMGDTITLALKNIPSLLGAAILWVLTIWVPYINVGTTIALFYGMPLELSRGKVMNPLGIFDGKYRKYMGEFFTCIGMMALSIIPALMFMVIPGIIISIGWSFAILLLVDKEMNPAQAMQKSTEYTYGYKLMMFISSILLGIFLVIVYLIVAYLANVLPEFLALLLIFAVLVFSIGLNLCLTANFYRYLVVERTAPLPPTPEV